MEDKMIRRSPLDLSRRSIMSMISDAKRILIKNDIPSPYFINLSPTANQALLDELEKGEGKRHIGVLEIDGMSVRIDPDCPPQGAYIVGNIDREEKKWQPNV